MKCTICKETITGYGNNAQPINDGRCCDKCNDSHVVPLRIALLSVRHSLVESQSMVGMERLLIKSLYKGEAA